MCWCWWLRGGTGTDIGPRLAAGTPRDTPPERERVGGGLEPAPDCSRQAIPIIDVIIGYFNC